MVEIYSKICQEIHRCNTDRRTENVRYAKYPTKTMDLFILTIHDNCVVIVKTNNIVCKKIDDIS